MELFLNAFRAYVNVLCRLSSQSGEHVNAMDRLRFLKLAAFLAPLILRSRQLEAQQREHEDTDVDRAIRRRRRNRFFHQHAWLALVSQLV